jgi:hypothetical protein
VGRTAINKQWQAMFKNKMQFAKNEINFNFANHFFLCTLDEIYHRKNRTAIGEQWQTMLTRVVEK